MPESPAPGSSTGRARGRGARRSARDRGRRGRGRGSGRGMTLQLSPEDLRRMQDLQAQRIAYEDVTLRYIYICLFSATVMQTSTTPLTHTNVCTIWCFFSVTNGVFRESFLM